MKNSELFIERHKGGERALLVQMYLYLQTPEDALTEFKELARSDGVTILDVVTGNLSSPFPKYFLGKGKAEEIRERIVLHEIEVVLVNHELTPAQGRNLEELFQCRVLDRTELILDIFAQRARTHEGKLQVELAQLHHLRTRLVGGWTHLERQKGGIGLRGPGETQLESDRRIIDQRIKTIKSRLEKVAKTRKLGRRARQRKEIPSVSLVGYTNAGKSTLFNAMTDSHVYAAAKLFATLDPTLRQLEIEKIGRVVVADTVGFIRDLPHDLVAAFRATLEETKLADLLLHVTDASEPNTEIMIERVQNVLHEIAADKVPQLLIMNKIDLLGQKPKIDYQQDGMPYRVWVSAVTGQGIDLLYQAISEMLAKRLVSCQIKLPAIAGKLRAKLYDIHAVISETTNEEGEFILELEIKQADFDRLLK